MIFADLASTGYHVIIAELLDMTDHNKFPITGISTWTFFPIVPECPGEKAFFAQAAAGQGRATGRATLHMVATAEDRDTRCGLSTETGDNSGRGRDKWTESPDCPNDMSGKCAVHENWEKSGGELRQIWREHTEKKVIRAMKLLNRFELSDSG